MWGRRGGAAEGRKPGRGGPHTGGGSQIGFLEQFSSGRGEVSGGDRSAVRLKKDPPRSVGTEGADRLGAIKVATSSPGTLDGDGRNADCFFGRRVSKHVAGGRDLELSLQGVEA